MRFLTLIIHETGLFATLPMQDSAGDYKSAFAALVAMIIVLLLGAAVYATTENMLFLDALYFTVVTASTVRARSVKSCKIQEQSLPSHLWKRTQRHSFSLLNPALVGSGWLR
jgi:hypothetical protein|eukprot:COSAG06_NODE_1742_length_8503_cov_6.223703_4_plen_112_part_00